MTVRILTVASARASARTSHQPLVAHPVMLGASVDPEAKLSAPSSLLLPLVSMRPVLNPVLDELAHMAGLERASQRSFKGVIKSLDPTALTRFFTALPGRSIIGDKAFKANPVLANIKRPSAAKELRELFASRPELNGLTSLDFSGRAPLAPGIFILVRLRPNLQIDFITEGFAAELGLGLDMFSPRPLKPLKLLPSRAFEVMEEASSRGVPLLDYGRPARVRELSLALDSSIIVSARPGWPCESIISAGVDTSQDSVVTDPVRAMSSVSRFHQEAPVAISSGVVELADMILAGPAGREGFKDYQDHFVSLYLASDKGAICALDTGMGKTVTAAGVIRSEAKAGYVTVITAPAMLRGQWVKELNKWAPVVDTRILGSTADVTAALLTRPTAPTALILSHDLLAKNAELFAAFPFDDFIIDEARVVSAGSKRVKSFRLARSGARRAMALTGTPAERDNSELAGLAALVRDDDTLLEEVVKGAYDPKRLGPILFRRHSDDVVGQIPDVFFTQSIIEPSPEETLLLDTLVSAVTARRDLLVAARMSGDSSKVNSLRSSLTASVNLLRAAVSDPTNVLRSQSGLALELTQSGLVAPAAANSARRQAVTSKVKSMLSTGQVLVCSDFVGSCDAFVANAASEGLRAAALTGVQDHMERTMICAAFESGDLDVLALSASAQRGVNLQTASSLVHLDLPLTSTMVTQRTGRAVRLGSAHSSVNVEVPLYMGTTDEVLLHSLSAFFDAGMKEAPAVSVLTDEASLLLFVKRLVDAYASR